MTIETEESLHIRGGVGHRFYPMWCPTCRDQVQMVTAEHAAEFAGVTPRTIYRWIEAASIHYVENTGRLMICLPALCLHAGTTVTSGRDQHPSGSKS